MADFHKDDGKPLFRKSTPASLKLALFVMLSLGALMLQQRTELLNPARDYVKAAIQPVRSLAALPTKLSSLETYFTSRHTLADENRHLRKQLLMLQAKVQKFASLQSENAHIRKLLKSSEEIQHRILITKIIAASPDPYRHNVILNKGKSDGVGKGLALVDSYGIMGQVVGIGPYTSTVLLITDANSGVPVRINRTGLQTMAEGTGDGFMLRLPYLPINTDIKPGDLLVSSGLGGSYPSGYPVAKVTQVSRKTGQDFLSVLAEPTAHLHKTREALLVWGGKRMRNYMRTSKQTGGNLKQLAENDPSPNH